MPNSVENEAWSLRPATPEDLPAMLAIERQSHPAPWSDHGFRDELAKPFSNLLVLTDDETDEQVAGYICFWMMFEDCVIQNIAVAPEMRGRGFARRLLRKSAQLGMQRGCKRMTLEVRKSNLPAMQLYQSLGFAITQIRKEFYSNGEDAYQMALALEEDGVRF